MLYDGLCLLSFIVTAASFLDGINCNLKIMKIDFQMSDKQQDGGEGNGTMVTLGLHCLKVNVTPS